MSAGPVHVSALGIQWHASERLLRFHWPLLCNVQYFDPPFQGREMATVLSGAKKRVAENGQAGISRFFKNVPG